MLTREDRENGELVKKIWLERRHYYHTSEIKTEKVNLETEKIIKWLKHIPMSSITKLIYTGAKLLGDEIGIPKRNQNRNAKPGRESRQKEFTKKLDNKRKDRNTME